jgi:putative transposase
VSSVPLQQCLRDLQTAFTNFFDKRAAYPSFKHKEARQSANYTKNGFSFDAERRTLKLAKIGAIKVKWSRRAIPEPSPIRLIRAASGKYFVSLMVETQPAPLPKSGESVGIDFGWHVLPRSRTVSALPTRSMARSGNAAWPSTRSASHDARRVASGA